MLIKATVIIYIYNDFENISHCIDSVLNQTYNDYEIIVINDGSTDSTDDIIQNHKSPFIKYLKNEKRIGKEESLLRVLRLIKSDYFLIINANDIIPPDRLEIQINYMDSNPDIGISGGLVKTIGKDTFGSSIPITENEINANLIFNSPFVPETIIIRNSIIKDKDLFCNLIFTNKGHELFLKLKDQTKFTNLNKVLVFHKAEQCTTTIQKTDNDYLKNKIFERNLSELGIKYSLQDVETYLSVFLRKFDGNRIEFKKIDKLFKKLIFTNSKKNIYPKLEFEKFLTDLWWTAYNRLENQNKFQNTYLFSDFHPINIKLRFLISLFKKKLIELIYPLIIDFFFFFCKILVTFEKKYIPLKGTAAIIASSLPPDIIGGVSAAHYNIFLKLQSKGYQVNLISYLNKFSSDKYKLESKHGKLSSGIIKLLIKWSEIYYDNKSPGELAFHTKEIISGSFGAIKLNKQLRLLKPEFIIFPDHLAPAYFYKPNKNVKTILISHHNPLRFLNRPETGKFSEKDLKFAVKIENEGLKKIQNVICVSEYMRKEFYKTYQYSKKVSVINNLINIELIESIQELDILAEMKLQEAIKIYFPAAGATVKGGNILMEIIVEISKNFPEKSIICFINSFINENLLLDLKMISKNIHIYAPGYIPYEKNIAFLKSCHFGISPTYAESFGMAILEANFCGVPMICHNIDAISEIIENGKNGFLVDKNDIEQIIKNIEFYLNSSNIQNEKRKCKDFVYQKFDSEITIKKYLNVIYSFI